MCLPYRRIEDVSDKLSKNEIDVLIRMLKSDIQSLTYLNSVSNDFATTASIKEREIIMHKLKLIGD